MEVMELIQIKTHLPAVNNCLLELGSLLFPICSYLANFFLKRKKILRTWTSHDSHRIILLVSSVPWLLHSYELPTKYGQDKNIGFVWYVCLNNNFQFLWKYIWMKKCIEMRIILFENWKHVFKIMYQTTSQNFG